MTLRIRPASAFLPVVIAVLIIAKPASGQVTLAPVRDARHITQSHPFHWRALRNQYIVMQQRDYSCGAAALATIMKHYWGDDSMTEQRLLRVIESTLTVAELNDRFQNGLSMADLRKVAVSEGYVATVGRVSLEQLAEVKVPVVVAINYRGYDHFVVVRGIVDGWVYLADPTRGNVRLPTYVFADQWIESALLVVLRRGQTESNVSELAVTVEEVDAGWLNQQLPRTFPARVFTRGIR